MPLKHFNGSAKLQVKLDWKAYFENFCSEHGGDPLLIRGRLLFRDGWQYSSTDYKGPEWPPPTDTVALALLQRDYWARRLEIVRDEYNQLSGRLKYLADMQKQKSGHLQRSIVVEKLNDDGKKLRVPGVVDLDLALFEGRLDWLKADIVECEEQLTRLKETSDA